MLIGVHATAVVAHDFASKCTLVPLYLMFIAQRIPTVPTGTRAGDSVLRPLDQTGGDGTQPMPFHCSSSTTRHFPSSSMHYTAELAGQVMWPDEETRDEQQPARRSSSTASSTGYRPTQKTSTSRQVGIGFHSSESLNLHAGLCVLTLKKREMIQIVKSN